MKKLWLLALLLLTSTQAYAVDFCKRFPTDTAIECYTPTNPPPGGGGGNVGIGSTIISGTTGSVLYVGTGPVFAQDNANFFWDSTGHNLGLGTTIPKGKLTVMSGNVGIGTWIPGEILSVSGNLAKPVIGNNATHTTIYSSYDSQTNTGLEINNTSSAGSGNAGLILSQNTTTNGVTLGTFTFAAPATAASEKRGVIIGSSLEGSAATNVTANLAFYTNNAGTLAERLRITPSGNVGIGTNVPESLLNIKSATVNGSDLKIQSTATDSYPSLTFKNDARSWTIYGSDGSNSDGFGIYDATAAAYRMMINSSGNIGVGTVTPSGTLIVQAGNVGIGTNVPTGARVQIGQVPAIGGQLALGFGADGNTGFNERSADSLTTTAGGTAVYTVDANELTSLGATGTVRLRFVNQAVNAPSYTFSDDNDTGMWHPTANAIAFSTNGAEIVRLDSAGNIGIGTTSPQTKLAIVGGNVGIGTWTTTHALDLTPGTTNAFGIGFASNMHLYRESTTGLTMDLNNSGHLIRFSAFDSSTGKISGDGSIALSAGGGGGIIMAPGDVQRAIFATGGNVGIGTDLASASGRLLVYGGNVGIGTRTPGAEVDVTGTVRASTDVKVGTKSLCQSDGTNCPASGSSQWLTTAGVGIGTYSNVGIGTTPSQNLLAIAANNAITQVDLDAYNLPSGIDTYAKLMLHMDGTNGSTTFTDSSSAPYTVTAVGNAQISTATFVFGTGSGLLDGTGDYLSVPDSADWSYGSADFTIDFRMREHVVGGSVYPGVVCQRNGTSYVLFESNAADDSQWVFNASTAGVGQANYTFNWAPVADTWYHVAVVRNGTNFYVFINGVSQSLTVNTAIGTNTLPDVSAALQIGAEAGAQVFNGNFDELRISKGVARWTSNFTPPTSAYSTGTATQKINFKSAGVGYGAIGATTSDNSFQVVPATIGTTPSLWVNMSAPNVGIGTLTGGSNLSVVGNASFGSYAVTAAPTGGIIASGNVGFGVSAPAYILDVLGTPRIRHGTGSNYASRNDALLFNRSDLLTSYTNKITSSQSNVAADTLLNFELTNTAGSGFVTAMTLNAAGSVGIGTSTPTPRLDVLAASDTDIARFRGTTSGLRVQSNTGTVDIIGIDNADTGAKPILIREAGASTGIYLSSGSNVGIGSNVPGATLDVSGGIRSTLGGSSAVGACWCTTPPKVLGYCTGVLGTCSACNYNGSGC